MESASVWFQAKDVGQGLDLADYRRVKRSKELTRLGPP